MVLSTVALVTGLGTLCRLSVMLNSHDHDAAVKELDMQLHELRQHVAHVKKTSDEADYAHKQREQQVLVHPAVLGHRFGT